VTIDTDPIEAAIAPLRSRLKSHRLYSQIQNVQQLRLFMESHVFAVWDFMSLLKWLQAHLTCVTIPWAPSAHPQASRLINEIVLGEESDTFGSGYISHFDLYLRAMNEAGADTSAIRKLLAALAADSPMNAALQFAEVPAEAAAFVLSTFDLLRTEKPHVIAAAFTFGREDLIPDMFREMVRDLRRHFEGVALFEYYLERHIEVDGESHGPMALQMVQELCGNDEAKWREATHAAELALEARLALWDGIALRIAAV
jgi:hypothetical protein